MKVYAIITGIRMIGQEAIFSVTCASHNAPANYPTGFGYDMSYMTEVTKNMLSTDIIDRIRTEASGGYGVNVPTSDILVFCL